MQQDQQGEVEKGCGAGAMNKPGVNLQTAFFVAAAVAACVTFGCGPAGAQTPDDAPDLPAKNPEKGPERGTSAVAQDAVEEATAQPTVEIDPRTQKIEVELFDPSGEALRTFWDALTAAADGNGQARIAWWGASHTAADLWSGHVRRALQDKFGDAGHGYLLPYRWHGGYRHQDINLRYSRGWRTHRHKLLNPVPVGDYGYGGVAISSDDPKHFFEIATTVDNEHGRKADVLEVWLRADREGGSLNVQVDGKMHRLSSRGKVLWGGKRKRLSSRKKRRKGRKSGLSAPKGWTVDRVDGVLFYRLQLKDGGHKVVAHPAGDGRVYVYGAVLQRTAVGVVVDQMGIPGMRGKIQLHWQEDTWRAQLRRRDPHLLILAYGTNSVGDRGQPISRFKNKWRRVLERLKNAVPRASCLLVGPTDRPTRADADGNRVHRPRMDTVIAAQKAVAAEYGCGYWDAFEAMGGRGSMLRWVKAGLGRPDHVHLSREGYELKGDRFLASLLRGYKP